MDVILREIKQASREQIRRWFRRQQRDCLIDAATQQNSCLVEESVAAAASLNEQALHLKELVNVFRVREETRSPLNPVRRFPRRAINHADNAFDFQRVADIIVRFIRRSSTPEVIQRPLHLRIFT